MDRHLPLIRRTARRALWAAPVLFIGYFFVYPLVTVLVIGVSGGDGSTPAQVLGDATTYRVLWFTLWQAAASTALTVILGLPAAYAIGRYRFPGRSLVRAALTVPFVLPTVVVGAAFLAIFGRGGLLGVDLRGTVWAILIAHVFYNLAVVVRTVSTAWEQLDETLVDAARTLGADRRRAFREITLPAVAPAVASAASIVFLFTFTSFGVILILGDIATSTIEVEIWRRAIGFQDLGAAAALSLLQLIGVSAILWWYARYQERRSVALPRSGQPLVTPRRPAERLLVAGAIGGTLLLVLAPLVALVAGSLRVGDGLGVANFTALATRQEALFVPPLAAIGNSLRFALPAATVAVVIGLGAARLLTSRRGAAWFDTVLMLPLGTSAVTLGFGMLVALDRPIDLRTSLWLVPMAHALVGIPFVVRSAVPILRSIRQDLREAAALLGASPERVWREVDLPIVSRAVAVGAGFALAVSLGEFGATTFLALPDAPTLPVAIFRLLGQPGTLGSALALATVLMVLTTLAIVVVERLRVPGGDW